jgi:hypothetical protein
MVDALIPIYRERVEDDARADHNSEHHHPDDPPAAVPAPRISSAQPRWEILVPRHQVMVPERQLGKARPRFSLADRAFLAALRQQAAIEPAIRRPRPALASAAAAVQTPPLPGRRIARARVCRCGRTGSGRQCLCELIVPGQQDSGPLLIYMYRVAIFG